MTKGIIFNIQKFSVNDGPGIRTTVFMKGCPLRCLWCHNPESNGIKPDLLFSDKKCSLCGGCVAACPNQCHSIEIGKHLIDRTKCTACGKCVEACPVEALELAGYTTSVAEVIDEVLKDHLFYETSGGGMTLSGGEPMYQFEFALQFLKAAKAEGLHTCIETCGFAKPEHYRAISEYVDIFLFDYKLTDSQLHMQYTGVDNRLILQNLRMLDNMGCNIILRCPIIPTINDTYKHFAGIAKAANSLKHIQQIHIEPYHPLGSDKMNKLGKNYALEELAFPSNETVQGWIDEISCMTEVSVIKG